MTKVRIEYKRNECIGAGVCAVFAPNEFEMNQDGLADLKSSQESDGLWTREVEIDNVSKLVEAAEGCPVRIIKIIEADSGKVLAGD